MYTAVIDNSNPSTQYCFIDFVQHLTNSKTYEVVTIDEEYTIEKLYMNDGECIQVNFDGEIFNVKCEKSKIPLRWREVISYETKYTISHKSKEKLDAFFEHAMKYCENLINRGIVHEGKTEILNFDFTWTRLCKINKRKWETVYLPKNTKEKIKADLRLFLSEPVKKRYSELCIPHTRTYMFYGIPGTGKTTLIKALAAEFNQKVAVISMTRDCSDSDILRAFQNLPKNTFLIIEDIDCLFCDRDANTKTTGVSFSGFLNTLDGISSKSFVVFITTNKLDFIDSALKRRVDYYLKFDYILKDQTQDMFTNFFPQLKDKFSEWYKNIKKQQLTTNIIQKFFTKYLFEDITSEELIDEFNIFTTSEISDKKVSMYT